MALRSAGWRMLHPDIKQAKGLRLDACQMLQDVWLQFRQTGSAIFWYAAAQDRALKGPHLMASVSSWAHSGPVVPEPPRGRLTPPATAGSRLDIPPATYEALPGIGTV